MAKKLDFTVTKWLASWHCAKIVVNAVRFLFVTPRNQDMVWNGTEISVWNTKDTRIKWNGRFQEWNGRQSSILPYQFHTRFRTWILQKNIVITKNMRKRIAANHLSTN